MNKATAILQTVAKIPRGRVASYGTIARLAGLGRNARLVGYVLHHDDGAAGIPWHRVVSFQGEILVRDSGPTPTFAAERQRALLEAEGIRLSNRGRIDMSKYAWNGPITKRRVNAISRRY